LNKLCDYDVLNVSRNEKSKDENRAFVKIGILQGNKVRGAQAYIDTLSTGDTAVDEARCRFS